MKNDDDGHGRRRDAHPRLEQAVALMEVAAGEPDVGASGGSDADRDHVRQVGDAGRRVGVLDRHDGVGASGTMAPVRMRTAVPALTSASGACPALDSPTTRSVLGQRLVAPVTSAACTAKPSMALLSQGGIVTCATIGSARTRPTASSTPTVVGGSGCRRSSIRARAASSESRPLTGLVASSRAPDAWRETGIQAAGSDDDASDEVVASCQNGIG